MKKINEIRELTKTLMNAPVDEILKHVKNYNLNFF
jgi:hypothetical protein